MRALPSFRPRPPPSRPPTQSNSSSLTPSLTPLGSTPPGSGSGYLLPIFHSLVQPLGTVLGIDHVPALVDLARANLAADPLARDLLAPEGGDKGVVQCLVGDGREGAPKGWVPEGGWQVRWSHELPGHRLQLCSCTWAKLQRPAGNSLPDSPPPPPSTQAIHVGAAAPSLPSPLLSQLASPGRMFIPLGTDDQAIYQVDKDAEGRVTETRLYGVRYVPLTDRETQAPGGRA